MNQIQTCLDQLAHLTPDQIHHLLRDQHITGTRSNPYRCPIANYLKTKTGHKHIAVNRTTARIMGAPWSDGQPTPLPSAVRTFTRLFDAQCYPDLDNRPDHTPQQASHAAYAQTVRRRRTADWEELYGGPPQPQAPEQPSTSG